jgi:hypothetical protein
MDAGGRIACKAFLVVGGVWTYMHVRVHDRHVHTYMMCILARMPGQLLATVLRMSRWRR